MRRRQELTEVLKALDPACVLCISAGSTGTKHCQSFHSPSFRASTAFTASTASAGTFFTSIACGIGKRGIDLEKCYEGQYKDGKRTGYGVYKYPNGYMTYEGEYLNGQKHGEAQTPFSYCISPYAGPVCMAVP